MKLRIFGSVLILIWLTVMLLNAIDLYKIDGRNFSGSWWLYNVFMFISLVIVDWYDEFKSRLLPYVYYLTLSHFIIFNIAILFDLYNENPIINNIEHAYGSFILIMVVFAFISFRHFFDEQTIFSKRVLIFSLGNLVVTFNEIVELFLDTLFKTTNIGPEIWDTNMDLIMNWLGFSVFFVIGFLYRKVAKKNFLNSN